MTLLVRKKIPAIPASKFSGVDPMVVALSFAGIAASVVAVFAVAGAVAVAIAAGPVVDGFLTGQRSAGHLPCYVADSVHAGAFVRQDCAV